MVPGRTRGDPFRRHISYSQATTFMIYLDVVRSGCRHALVLASVAVAAMLADSSCTRAPSDSTVRFDPEALSSPYASPSAALLWCGATRSFQVDSAGALYNGAWRTTFSLSSGVVTARGPTVIAAESRWCPILEWRRRSGKIVWDFQAVAAPAPAPAESVLLAAITIRATNDGDGDAIASLRSQFESPRHPFWVAADAPDSSASLPRWANHADSDLAAAVNDRATPTGLTLDWHLSPHSSHEVQLTLSSYPISARILVDQARIPFSTRARLARRYWEQQVSAGSILSVHDTRVESAARAAKVLLLQSRACIANQWLPVGGPFQYSDVWLRDGARSIAALSVWGFHQQARDLASGLALFQWPMGAFMSQRGQLDGTGQAQWAMAQAALRPGPDSTVSRFADVASGGLLWLRRQRALGRQTGWPFGAMLPFAEPHDNELTRAQLVGNDAWSIAGMEGTARLLRAAGRETDAAEADSMCANYRRDFATALQRTRRKDVPPSWQGSGRDWGNLAVAWPCRALQPEDPHMAALAERIWTRPDRMVSLETRDTVQLYVGADLGTWALLSHRPREAQAVLNGLLQWLDATGNGAEIVEASTHSFGWDLPPHPTTAAALLMLIRNSVVYDDGDTLQLTLGPADAWWDDGRFTRAATRWGDIDVTFRRRGQDVEWTWSPVSVWTELNLPSGFALAARPPAPLRTTGRTGVILAPPGTRDAHVRVRAMLKGAS